MEPGYDPRRTWSRWLLRQLSFHAVRKKIRRKIRLRRALSALAAFPRNSNAKKHDLCAPLIVSLTSYPARFPTLHLTIMALLDQTVRPDRIVLWVEHGALTRIPPAVKALEGDLFEVRGCNDVGSLTKIVPSLEKHPDAFIVVADDDTYYPQDWLAGLIEAYDPLNPSIVYHRGHRLTYSADGRLAPYRSWEREVADDRSLAPGVDVMPTGVAGVLYPPSSLPAETADIDLVKRLSKTCDDSWLYFMWRQTNWTAKRTARSPDLLQWPETQKQSLRRFHRGGAKDEHLRALSEHFGVP